MCNTVWLVRLNYLSIAIQSCEEIWLEADWVKIDAFFSPLPKLGPFLTHQMPYQLPTREGKGHHILPLRQLFETFQTAPHAIRLPLYTWAHGCSGLASVVVTERGQSIAPFASWEHKPTLLTLAPDYRWLWTGIEASTTLQMIGRTLFCCATWELKGEILWWLGSVGWAIWQQFHIPTLKDLSQDARYMMCLMIWATGLFTDGLQYGFNKVTVLLIN